MNQDKDLTNVTVQNSTSGKTTTLRTTQHHPFWDNTDQRWIDAANLTIGHKLLVADDEQLRQPKGDNTGAGLGGGGPGTTATITHVVNFNGDKTMHDLTIADIHTYYVIAGNTPVLVHNCGGGLNRLIGSLRNKANDTYIGRLITGRPMEPWRSNRILSRQLAGEPAPANATVRDLVGMQNGNGAIGYKVADANGRLDEDLLASVFNPQDGQYIATSASQPNVITQGNHRAMQLIARALDPLNDNINLDTEIFIHRVGQQ